MFILHPWATHGVQGEHRRRDYYFSFVPMFSFRVRVHPDDHIPVAQTTTFHLSASLVLADLFKRISGSPPYDKGYGIRSSGVITRSENDFPGHPLVMSPQPDMRQSKGSSRTNQLFIVSLGFEWAPKLPTKHNKLMTSSSKNIPGISPYKSTFQKHDPKDQRPRTGERTQR